MNYDMYNEEWKEKCKAVSRAEKAERDLNRKVEEYDRLQEKYDTDLKMIPDFREICKCLKSSIGNDNMKHVQLCLHIILSCVNDAVPDMTEMYALTKHLRDGENSDSGSDTSSYRY
jgi:hypothetical protein